MTFSYLSLIHVYVISARLKLWTWWAGDCCCAILRRKRGAFCSWRAAYLALSLMSSGQATQFYSKFHFSAVVVLFECRLPKSLHHPHWSCPTKLFLQLTDSKTFSVYYAFIRSRYLFYLASLWQTENVDPLPWLCYLCGLVSLLPPSQVAGSLRSPASCRAGWALSPGAGSGHSAARDSTAFSLGSCVYLAFCPYGRRRWHCSRSIFTIPCQFCFSNPVGRSWTRCWPSWGFEYQRCQALSVCLRCQADLLVTQIDDTS